MNKTTIITLATSSLVALTAHAQNLILNGSFESPVISANSFQAAPPTSWSWSETSGLIHNGDSGSPSVWPLPQDGQQFANVGNESFFALSQDFTITNQGIYALRWYDSSGHSGGLTTSPYSVTILTGAVQTVTTSNLNAYHATFGAWVGRSLRLTLSPGTYKLRFRAEGVFDGLDSLIDNVSLERLPDEDLLASIHCSAVDICWAGLTNQQYQVQYRTNVSDTSWFDLGAPLLGTGTNCVTDQIKGTEHRFYRVIRVP